MKRLSLGGIDKIIPVLSISLAIMSVTSISTPPIIHSHSCYEKSLHTISSMYQRVCEYGLKWHQPLSLAGFLIVWLKFSFFYAASYITVATLTYNVSMLFFTEEKAPENKTLFSDFLY